MAPWVQIEPGVKAVTDNSQLTSPAPSALAVEVEAAVERAVARALSKLAGGLGKGLGQIKPCREQPPENRDFIDFHKAGAMTGLSRTTIIRGVRDGSFPQPIKFGRRSLFKRDEVQSWIEARLAERSPAA